MNHLSPCEREVIITANDAERGVVHVFTESRSTLATRLFKVARAVGADVTPAGEGFAFDLPTRCLSARIPKALSAAQLTQRRQATAASQRARFRAENSGAPSVATPSGVLGVPDPRAGVRP